jgi:hypothetical protein
MAMTASSVRTILRTPRVVLAILTVALVATPVLALPYVLLDRDASRIDVETDLAWIVLAIHAPAAAFGGQDGQGRGRKPDVVG